MHHFLHRLWRDKTSFHLQSSLSDKSIAEEATPTLVLEVSNVLVTTQTFKGSVKMLPSQTQITYWPRFQRAYPLVAICRLLNKTNVV